MAIGFRIDGVVMVARVFRVDGDERDLCEVFAWRLGGLRLVGFVDDSFREFVRYAMRVHRDDGGRARIIQPAENFDDAGAARTIATGRPGLDAHEIAIRRVLGVGALDDELALFLARCRLNRAAMMVRTINADQGRFRRRVDLLDRACAPDAVTAFFDLAERALADAER